MFIEFFYISCDIPTVLFIFLAKFPLNYNKVFTENHLSEISTTSLCIPTTTFKGRSRHKVHHYEERGIFFIRHFSILSTLHRNDLAA